MISRSDFGLPCGVLDSILSTLAAFDKIDKALIFGSRVTENYRIGSDIDLCLYGKDLTNTDRAGIISALDELPFAYKFDVVVYELLSAGSFRDRIDQSGVLIYGKK